VVKETGGIDALQIETAWPVPKIADGQVLVKNEFSGINFIDTYHRSGLYKRDLPFVGGQEGGGTIAAVTPKAEAMGFKVGQRVAYSILQTYCEYSAVPAAKLQPVPDNVGLDVATACVVQVSISPQQSAPGKRPVAAAACADALVLRAGHDCALPHRHLQRGAHQGRRVDSHPRRGRRNLPVGRAGTVFLKFRERTGDHALAGELACSMLTWFVRDNVCACVPRWPRSGATR
jgi:hypothetical protein